MAVAINELNKYLFFLYLNMFLRIVIEKGEWNGATEVNAGSV